MRAELCVVSILSCLACTLLSLGPAQAAANSYIEDFTSKQYCDTVNTTAWWDTVAGEVKLPPFELTLAGSYNTPDAAMGVAISGDYAYVADRFSGLQVVDISDPAGPTLAGSYNTPDQAHGVAIAGDYAYVADGFSGLQVIDIANPAGPTLAGSHDTPGAACGVAIAGDYAYVAGGHSGLQVIDISNPPSPTFAGSHDTPGYARDVAISGDYAYVADGMSGLQVVDISSPPSPTLAGSYNTPDFAWNVAISGDYAYVADHASGLQVIDIADPASPTLVCSYSTPSYAWDVAISGDYAYVADQYLGLQVIDIVNPASPTLVGSYDTPDYAIGVAISGDYAYVADSRSGLQVIHIAEPVVPPRLVRSGSEIGGYAIEISGNYAYSRISWGGPVTVVDITDPENPLVVATYHTHCPYMTPSLGYGIAILGDYAYATGEINDNVFDEFLEVIDISDPTAPTWAGLCFPGGSGDIVISGDYAYVGAVTAGGLRVIDISNPAQPVPVGSCGGLSHPAFSISGDYIYAADDRRFRVVDVADPTNPTLAGDCDGTIWLNDVAVSGDYAYACGCRVYGDAGLFVIDISDPTTPALAGSCATPRSLDLEEYGLAISGDYAYVACGDPGLWVIDISDPTAPTSVGCYDARFASAVAISGDYAYGSGQVLEILQRHFSTNTNTVQSLPIDESDRLVVRARLTTTQTDSIRWELSADGGANWQEMVPGGTFLEFDYPGSDLLWRSTHIYTGKGVNPTCITLEIEWVCGLVASVDIDPDVLNPRSAGRWVTAYIELPGGYDPADIDVSTVLLNETVPAEAEPTSVGDHDEDGIPDRTVKFSRSAVIDILPNGEHVEVCVSGEVAGHSFEGCDTIRVLMPKVKYPNGGEILEVREQCIITWELPAGYEADWSSVYYTADDAESWNLIDDRVEGTSCTWVVPDVSSDRCRVLVEAYDPQGVMGYDISDQVFALSAGAGIPSEEAIPTSFALYPVSPNPFTQGTAVSFDLPDSRHVKLTVHDVRGRLVQKLIDEVRPAESQSVRWDGKDSFGVEVPAGIYFVHLEADDYEATGKIVLVR